MSSIVKRNVVWVLGAGGFIGGYLTSRLASDGICIAGLGHGKARLHSGAHFGLMHWINGDVSYENLELLQQAVGVPDAIYHLAGGSSVSASFANPRLDFMRTVDSTLHILEWLRLHSHATKLLVASSAAVYGAECMGMIDEDHRSSPFSPYGYHKQMMEQLCRSYASTFGIKVVISRLFSVYGEFLQKQLLWDLCQKLGSCTSSIELGGTGHELRDWVHVSDVIRGLVLMMDMASDQVPVFNLGTGEATSVRDVVEIVTAAWPNSVNVSFSGLSRMGDPFSLVANVDRLVDLGFEWRVPVAIGIKNYVDWYISNSRGCL